jgi:hypothetical protein
MQLAQMQGNPLRERELSNLPSRLVLSGFDWFRLRSYCKSYDSTDGDTEP